MKDGSVDTIEITGGIDPSTFIRRHFKHVRTYEGMRVDFQMKDRQWVACRITASHILVREVGTKASFITKTTVAPFTIEGF